MKKLLLIVPTVLLLAAACNQQPAVQQNTQTNTQPAQTTPTPPQNQTQTPPVNDNTNNWKTYTSLSFGYSVKYPSSWSIDNQRSTANEVVFNTDIAESRESISVQNYSKTLNDWKNSLDQSVIVSTKNLTVGGQAALQINTSEFAGKLVGVVYNGKLYMFNTQGAMTDNGMSNTFVFTTTTSQNQNSDWKIYSNSTYNYQIKYPKDFTVKITSAKDVSFQKSASILFTVVVSDNPTSLNAQGLQTSIDNQAGEGYPYQESFIPVSGINSFKQARYDDGVQEFYFIPSGNKTFNLNFKFGVGAGISSNNQNIQLINQILATFQIM